MVEHSNPDRESPYLTVDQFPEVKMLVNYPLKLFLRDGEKVKMQVSKSWPLRTTIMGI
jgi:hypothetical protein